MDHKFVWNIGALIQDKSASRARLKTEQERETRELFSKRLADIESRGFIAWLLNRKPESVAAG